MKLWLLSIVLLAGCTRGPERPKVVTSPDSPAYDAGFWKTWGDGQAELTSYELIYPRYGAPRKGTAVAITVGVTDCDAVPVATTVRVFAAEVDAVPVLPT